jgi:PIN domain nuclease of toxin-antitoxin system
MILLDTHIWFRWCSKADPLPRRVAELISMSDTVAVSAISVWKLIRLALRKRVDLKMYIQQWIELGLSGSGIRCLPITRAVASRCALLPEVHRDPADRLIIATALETRALLVSFDELFESYPELDGLMLGRKNIPDTWPGQIRPETR